MARFLCFSSHHFSRHRSWLYIGLNWKLSLKVKYWLRKKLTLFFLQDHGISSGGRAADQIQACSLLGVQEDTRQRVAQKSGPGVYIIKTLIICQWCSWNWARVFVLERRIFSIRDEGSNKIHGLAPRNTFKYWTRLDNFAGYIHSYLFVQSTSAKETSFKMKPPDNNLGHGHAGPGSIRGLCSQ